MTPSVGPYLEAAHRAAEWLIAQQNPDGSFISPELQADVYHKAPYALAITGHALEAERLLGWMKTNDLAEDGRLRHFDPGLALYKTSWVCQGAFRTGRFDLARPVLSYILRCQAPCGGFFQVVEGNAYVEPVCTAWAGLSAIYGGRLDVAEGAARCLMAMTDRQPDASRFCFWMTPDGRLVTPDAPLPGGAPFVDARQPEQPYYCPGIASLFLGRMYRASGQGEYVDAAMRLFEFSLGCADDAYAYTTAAKSGVAAALLYTITGDRRAQAAACRLADYLVREQHPEGWWRNPHADGPTIRLDHTAEFIAFITEIAATLGAHASG